MLDSFLLRGVSQWDNYEELNFMRNGTPQHLLFPFVYCLKTILLVGGLGVADKPHVFHGICFCGAGPRRKSAVQNQEHLMNWNNKFEILFRSCSFLKEKSPLYVFQIAEFYAKCGLKLKSDTE
jgi:hypothetical protein